MFPVTFFSHTQCGAASAECGVTRAECGMGNAECGVRLSFRIPNSGFRTPHYSGWNRMAQPPPAASLSCNRAPESTAFFSTVSFFGLSAASGASA